MRKINKKVFVAGAILVILLIAFGICAFVFQPKGSNESKTIQVKVINTDQSSEQFTINTNEEFLRGALEQEKLVEGTESDYGLFILTANGITADDSKKEWWCLTKGGEQVNTGVDATPIADGDQFELTLTTGW